MLLKLLLLDLPVSWVGLPVLTPNLPQSQFMLETCPSTPPVPVLLQRAAPSRVGWEWGRAGTGQDEQEAERFLEHSWCHRQVGTGWESII